MFAKPSLTNRQSQEKMQKMPTYPCIYGYFFCNFALGKIKT